jgi:hypothetical protein
MNEVQRVEANVPNVKNIQEIRHLFFDFTQIICSKLKKTLISFDHKAK